MPQSSIIMNFLADQLAFFEKIVHLLSLKNRGVAQLGSARRSGRRGRRFKSCHPDLLNSKRLYLQAF